MEQADKEIENERQMIDMQGRALAVNNKLERTGLLRCAGRRGTQGCLRTVCERCARCFPNEVVVRGASLMKSLSKHCGALLKLPSIDSRMDGCPSHRAAKSSHVAGPSAAITFHQSFTIRDCFPGAHWRAR